MISAQKKLYLAVSLFFIFLPFTVIAQESTGFSTFQTIPFLKGNLSIESYVNALYMLSIAIASILVVLKLMGAGVKYMLTEIVTTKQQAKKDIQNALLGLAIILGAITILNTINPNLTKLDFLGNAERVTPKANSGNSSGSASDIEADGYASYAKECTEKGGQVSVDYTGALNCN